MGYGLESRRRTAALCAGLAGIAVVGWFAGRHSSPAAAGAATVAYSPRPLPCNPYEKHGVLLVNPSVPSENRWQPISSNPACQPEDLITPLANPLADPAALAYLTNKTIVVFGDSVDRGNVQNLCSFIPGSDLQLIGYNHRLSPPYPIGQEQGPEGFSNPVDGTRNWTTSEAARSFLCTVPSLGLRVLTLFHYGFREDDAWMRAQTHYFPPGKLEDRFDHVARGILDRMSATYGISPIPDLISFSPGFWELWRGVIAQDIELWLLEEEAKKTGVPVGYGTRDALDVWGDMSELEMERVEGRMAQVVRHLAMAWAVPGIEDGSARTPKILWRTLHHVKSHRKVPFTLVQALDQIGRRVVERLQEQGRKANLGELEYARWMERMRAEGTAGGLEQPWAQVRAMGLGERLGLNDWGALMLGQEKHFLDDIHPKAYPGSWLFSQMLLTQLKFAHEAALP